MTAQKCTLRYKYRAYAFWVYLTMDYAINFTELVMDLQYVANAARDGQHAAAWKVWRLVIKKINMGRIIFTENLKL